jgi:hypothetical protein
MAAKDKKTPALTFLISAAGLNYLLVKLSYKVYEKVDRKNYFYAYHFNYI